ncbi:helix-turn-helix domain-containing protein [Ferrimicrobium sp.]|jgi:excisionase family DNA binding protein|uniref:helix-turn-helix domain-containing protein n=1 Tax=Ferrimicrobium sp. TaxID=2926050 RepID=UPI00262C7C0D|nr:helix-turn-helix domain-containing protein [Ferrimicrobium sp.]
MTKHKTKEARGHKHCLEDQRNTLPDIRTVYTVAEAAQMLTLSTSTVRRLVKKEALRAVRTHGNGGRVLISHKALSEFLEERA